MGNLVRKTDIFLLNGRTRGFLFVRHSPDVSLNGRCRRKAAVADRRLVGEDWVGKRALPVGAVSARRDIPRDAAVTSSTGEKLTFQPAVPHTFAKASANVWEQRPDHRQRRSTVVLLRVRRISCDRAAATQSVSDQNGYGREATRRVARNSRRPFQGRHGVDRLIVALLVTITGQFKPLFVLIGLPEMAWPIVLVVVLAAPALYFWRDYRRYARQSRLEQPDKFTLVATTPESLIGRADDLERLVRAVMQNRIVLLDGELGCGKSALVASGLVPRLQNADGLLPVLVRDWGDDWVRGPLAATLEALYGALTTQQRERIAWPAAPDSAAPAPELAGELSDRLSAVAETLKRRPLLIADQFDDHQAQHRQSFIDAEGSWLTPTRLAKASPLWALVSQQLQDGQLHLLAVTRADTASGLSCLRFLDNSMITNRHPARGAGRISPTFARRHRA